MLPILLGGSGLILASLYMQGPTNNVRAVSYTHLTLPTNREV